MKSSLGIFPDLDELQVIGCEKPWSGEFTDDRRQPRGGSAGNPIKVDFDFRPIHSTCGKINAYLDTEALHPGPTR